MVVDAHTHAWGPDTEAHPWKTESMIQAVEELPIPTTYTAEELIEDMDRVGIDEAFVVGLPVTDWLDNWYVEKIAREYDRLYGIALVDPFADDAVATLRELMAIDDIVGFRLATVFPRDGMYEVDPADTVETDWLTDAIDRTAFWEACVETNAAVTLLSHYSQLDQVLELVETYPELTYVIDHVARTPGDVTTADPDFATFADLAEYDSVLVKASAIPGLSGEPYPHHDVEEKIRWLLGEFGRERVAWGSDYQFISAQAEYEETLTCLDHMDSLSDRDRTWLTERSFKSHLGE